MFIYKYFLLIVFLLINFNVGFAQNEYEKKYIELIPGEQYKAGWVHELFLGKHWRDLWTTPINVEILDLDLFAGGLSPLKKGGGFQTKSLRLLGNDGNIWKFRSMSKNPAKVLPEILRETFVADIFQDQISSANPLAALVAAPILSAVGILQSKPYLVYMPDDKKLGEFRDDFGGELGMIEIHPDVDEDENRDFEGADKIKSTFKMLNRLSNTRKENVASKEYLKARLVDIFLGDWDRHTDQWKWARYEINGRLYWKPIPRDRDQVFAKWDGIGPSVAEYLIPQFVHFDYVYPDIEYMTWSGRFIDRRFLTEITETVWDSVTIDLVNNLTDEVIENAISHLPKEHYKLAASELNLKLKSRRNLLKEYSKKYYKLINEVVDIYGSDKNDEVKVTRINNTETRVELFYRKKNKTNIIYDKTFNNSITDEIRIFLLDGKDKVVVNGEVDEGPLIRIIAGEGKDKLIDSSLVKGYFFSFTPIPSAEIKTEFYDSGKKTTTIKNSGTYFNDDKIEIPKDEYEKYEPANRNRGSQWWPSPILSFNSNDGLRLGMGAQFYKYNFRMDPYEYWMNLTAEYASTPKSFNIIFNGVYNSIIKGATVTLDVTRSELLFTNYYGFGNETKFDLDLEENEFYRIDEELFFLKSSIHLNYFGKISGSFGFIFKSSELELNNNKLLSTFKSEYGLHEFNLLKIHSNFKYDSRDGAYYTENGLYADVKVAYSPKLFDNKKSFFKTQVEISFFATLKTFTNFTLAMKVGGGKVFGDYPFFESIFIGGANDLRGYSRRRFAGSAGVYGQTELRTYLFPLKILVPGRFGVHAFVESGRVFDEEDNSSSKWHPSYGGGIWTSFVNNAVSLSLTVAKSSEITALYFIFGMGF